MTTESDSQTLNLRVNQEKMRRLFERFSQATGEEKKEVAREMMDQLLVRRSR